MQAENLNGLPREKLIEVLESFRDPKVFNAVTGPWKSRVVWQGGMRAKSYMRNHVAEMDEPGDLTATDAAASAHEQVLSAMGSCITVGFIVNATKTGSQGPRPRDCRRRLFRQHSKVGRCGRFWKPGLRQDQRQGLRQSRRRRGNSEGYLAAGGGRFARNPNHPSCQ